MVVYRKAYLSIPSKTDDEPVLCRQVLTVADTNHSDNQELLSVMMETPGHFD